MTYCTNCGTPSPEGSAFCSSCGTPLGQAPAAPRRRGLPMRCPAPKPTPWGKILAVMLVLIVLVVGAVVGGLVYVGYRVKQKVAEFTKTDNAAMRRKRRRVRRLRRTAIPASYQVIHQTITRTNRSPRPSTESVD